MENVAEVITRFTPHTGEATLPVADDQLIYAQHRSGKTSGPMTAEWYTRGINWWQHTNLRLGHEIIGYAIIEGK